MAGGLDMHQPLAFTFGLIGNIVSVLVYLAPMPTFYRIYKKKSTEGFQSLPYVVALFSAMLWIYYAIVKTNSMLLITINALGCIIETLYIAAFVVYAPRKAKVTTGVMFVLLNVVIFGTILATTLLLTHGPARVAALGWICVGVSVAVFAAPLSIITRVIRTKSVEYMPINLSVFLTLSAIAWMLYGAVTKDLYVKLPNILGISCGIVQVVIYLIYKNSKPVVAVADEKKQQEQLVEVGIQKIVCGTGAEVHPVTTAAVPVAVEERVINEVQVLQRPNDLMMPTCGDIESFMGRGFEITIGA